MSLGRIRFFTIAVFSAYAIIRTGQIVDDEKVNTNSTLTEDINSTQSEEYNDEEIVSTKPSHASIANNAYNLLQNNHFGGISLVSLQWNKLATYFIYSAFLLVAAIVKIIYHHTHTLNTLVPESCALIALGTAAGVALRVTNLHESVPAFSSTLFLYFLIPPIMLESAYSLHDHVFFSNFFTIMLYAVIGTIVNVILLAPTLNICSRFGLFGDLQVPMVESIIFSTIISAVDPVAVLAIFQEVNVNKGLYFLVFGESLFNDAVVIVLNNAVQSFVSTEFVSATEILLAFCSFVVVVGGGLLVGTFFGVITTLITRFTTEVRVVEPLTVVILAYISYITAELFHFSGIIGLVTCGLIQSEYSNLNVSKKSRTTIKYLTKTLSSISDVVIFFFLGRVLVEPDHLWNTSFIVITIVACIVYRFFAVFTLTYFANHVFQRVRPINFEEQVLMAYGGLRGGIAFSLTEVIDKDDINLKDLFKTSALVVILFTVYVLGTTTKPVVRLLRIKIEAKRESKLFLALNQKVIETVMVCVEEIGGQRSLNYWMQKFNELNSKYLKKWLVLSPTDATTAAYKKIYKERVQNQADSYAEAQLDTPEKDIYPDINEPLNVSIFNNEKGWFRTDIADTLRDISKKEIIDEDANYTSIQHVDRLGIVPWSRCTKVTVLMAEFLRVPQKLELAEQRKKLVNRWDTPSPTASLKAVLQAEEKPSKLNAKQQTKNKKVDLSKVFSRAKLYRVPKQKRDDSLVKGRESKTAGQPVKAEDSFENVRSQEKNKQQIGKLNRTVE